LDDAAMMHAVVWCGGYVNIGTDDGGHGMMRQCGDMQYETVLEAGMRCTGNEALAFGLDRV
jgi:hypothetical protein